MIVLAVVFSQIWPLFIIYGRWLGVSMLAMILLGTAALVATGRGQRSRAERFVISASGLARVDVRVGASGEFGSENNVFVPWEDADAVEVRRIGPLWAKLRIGVAGKDGRRMAQTIFEAGIRCPEAQMQAVEQAIRSCLTSGPAAPNAARDPFDATAAFPRHTTAASQTPPPAVFTRVSGGSTPPTRPRGV